MAPDMNPYATTMFTARQTEFVNTVFLTLRSLVLNSVHIHLNRLTTAWDQLNTTLPPDKLALLSHPQRYNREDTLEIRNLGYNMFFYTVIKYFEFVIPPRELARPPATGLRYHRTFSEVSILDDLRYKLMQQIPEIPLRTLYDFETRWRLLR